MGMAEGDMALTVGVFPFDIKHGNAIRLGVVGEAVVVLLDLLGDACLQVCIDVVVGDSNRVGLIVFGP